MKTKEQTLGEVLVALRAERQRIELRKLNAVIERYRRRINLLRAERKTYAAAGRQYRVLYHLAGEPRARVFWQGTDQGAMVEVVAQLELLYPGQQVWVQVRDVSEWKREG